MKPRNYRSGETWRRFTGFIFSLLFIPVVLTAQDESALDDEDIFELSPFTIETDEDEGYKATATLAGTRVRTDLKDIASSISVVTKQFLDDTGATSNETLLQYTTNTEVGGVLGNFAGTGNTQGVGESTNLTAPSTNTRVRGLDAADNTRNYFLTDIPWDGYIVDRVDLQRGPNSILFGVGSPAGIINTSTVVPAFENGGELQIRIDEHGSFRSSIDYSHVLIEDELAVRAAAVHDNQKFQQKPAYEKDQRGYIAFTYQPDWVEDGNTSINANYEHGKITANRPRSLTPVDRITPWWTGLGQEVYNAAWSWSNDVQIDRGNVPNAQSNAYANVPWLGNEMGGITGGGIGFFYDNGNATPTTIRQTDAQTNFGIGPDGSIDRSIQSFPFGRLQSVAAFNEYSKNAEADALAKGLENPYPGAAKNFYKDIHLSDPSIFDFYNKLIDGDNKEEWSEWDAFNVSFSQTFWGSRVGIEAVYDYQNYETGSNSVLGWRPTIGVDVNTHTGMIPVEYPTAIPSNDGGGIPERDTVVGGDPNPNVGRAYVSGGRPRSWERATERENFRVTGFAEFYGSDFFDDDSFLARLIGRNVITGLWNRDERVREERGWLNWAVTEDYANAIESDPNVNAQLDGWERGVSYAVYLSDPLFNTSTPWNLNLPGLEHTVSPSGNYSAMVFDSHWNAPGVDPSAYYRLPVDGAASTQSENWANYVGYTPMNVNILNAQEGDKEQLMTNVSDSYETLESYGFTFQGYWWDGAIVPTIGWRKDEITQYTDVGVVENGLRSTTEFNRQESGTTTGESVTWGVVAHSVNFLELPYDTNFSVFFNKSENFKAVNRFGFSGARLPTPAGESEDYGIVINTLDDKLTLKVTWYETTVQNADIGTSSPLGSNTWFLANIEAWGTASSLTHELFWNNELPGQAWFSNYGLVDENLWGAAGWENGPFSDEAINHPANQALFAAVEDWYATMPSQEFFDAYGLPIDVSKVGSFSDRRTMVDGGSWNPYNGIGSIQPAGGGKVNGQDPTMTIEQVSKGIEFEVQYRPIPNWNITINASKTEAKRGKLGNEIAELIEYQYNRFQGPAGDLRMWWGGDSTIRKYYNDFIYQAYLFQVDAEGQSAPEIRPWRFNLINNYQFTDGTLKGFSIGGALRWQDDLIAGYHLTPDNEKLDVTNPIYAGAETNVDVWMSYGKPITDDIDWRIQLNLRNVGADDKLIPVSVNPDGTTAVGRISYGMSWELTNTFSF